MNMSKLFETQKVLRERIGYNDPDRFNKLILALLVELGECANEWRGFKFWSKNQEPRIHVPNKIMGIHESEQVYSVSYKNPLLEEYVDGLHFVLELGIEIDQTPIVCDLYYKADSIDSQFIGLYKYVLNFFTEKTANRYSKLLMVYVGLGKMFGFTWEQIEQAYFEKNRINHQRQDNGY